MIRLVLLGGVMAIALAFLLGSTSTAPNVAVAPARLPGQKGVVPALTRPGIDVMGPAVFSPACTRRPRPRRRRRNPRRPPSRISRRYSAAMLGQSFRVQQFWWWRRMLGGERAAS